MSEEKTEQPTPKKQKDARKKGQVFKSQDLTQAALFLTAAAVLSFSSGYLFDSLRALMVESLDPKLLSGLIDQSTLVTRTANAATKFLVLSAPLLAALAIVAAAIDFFQMGGLNFAPEVLSPKFEKLNPIQGLQNILFKPRTYLELIKNLVKITAILWLAYQTFTSSLRDVVLSSRLGLMQTAALIPNLLFGLVFKIGGVFLILGAADFMLQKKLFMKELMMTKDEVKREFKDSEGDPEIKHQRKALYNTILNQNMLKSVPKAAAVVVNPTHLAVGLEYDEASMNAPRVSAKGAMLMAEKIIRIAKQHNVPIVRNIPLAHSLYALELDDEIPEELYKAVAEILNFVAGLTQESEA